MSSGQFEVAATSNQTFETEAGMFYKETVEKYPPTAISENVLEH